MTCQYLESVLIFFPQEFFLGNVTGFLCLWVLLSPWGYTSRKVHWESHRDILYYSFRNHHFQFWEKMVMIFFSHIPNVTFFCLPNKNLHKNLSVNLLVKNLHFRTSEMFLPSHLYLSFSIFNVFIMIFNSWSSARKGTHYFSQALPVALSTITSEDTFSEWHWKAR